MFLCMHKSWYDEAMDGSCGAMIFVASARYVWKPFGCELMHDANPFWFRSCTRRGNCSLLETRDNLIQALSSMCSYDDCFLEASYRNLIMGRTCGSKAVLRMATKCGLMGG